MLGATPDVIEATRQSMRPKDEEIECFEDNAISMDVFERMKTQWQRAGADGKVAGLRYEALPVVMRRCHVGDEAFDQVFDDVQIMEGVVMKIARDQ